MNDYPDNMDTEEREQFVKMEENNMSQADYVKGMQDGKRYAPRDDVLPYPYPANDYQREFNQAIANYELNRNKEEA